MEPGTNQPQSTQFQIGNAQSNSGQFVDRRNPTGQRQTPGFERRQFTNSHDHLTPDAAELGRAIDQYKLNHRRRFINYEEMLSIIQSLGYSKNKSS